MPGNDCHRPRRLSHGAARDLFRGPGGLIIEAFGGRGGASIADNAFEDCDVGLHLVEMDDVTVQNNLFRNCGQGTSFSASGTTLISGNRLLHCGVGIANSPFAPIWRMRVLENTVTDGSGIGIDLTNDGWDLDVHNNVVLRCAGTDMRITDLESGGNTARRITHNTSVGNGGSGYDLRLDNPYRQPLTFEVSNNVGYGNGGWGLQWTGADTPSLICNDWFGNATGAVSGTAQGATDLSVDPLFCDLPNDDVRLRSDSPLLGGACGTIGARGIGCDASTEVLVALFAAEASDEGVRIRWRLGGDEQPLSVWIERAAGELGPWLRVATERSVDGVVATDWDRTAEPGRRYWYRLAWSTADGRTTYSSPIVIDLASPASSLALSVIGPNPASGPVAIEYVLPRSTAIDLTVHDLMGREVTRLASGIQSKGLHVTQWTGNHRGGRARPGVHFVRLRSPEGQQSRRILLRN